MAGREMWHLHVWEGYEGGRCGRIKINPVERNRRYVSSGSDQA